MLKLCYSMNAPTLFFLFVVVGFSFFFIISFYFNETNEAHREAK